MRKKTTILLKTNQPRSAKSTSYRCGGISSTHTDKPLTCLACLARLWATLSPLLRIRDKAIQLLVTRVGFADSRIWPNVDREDSVFQRVFITTSESPSSINSVIPSSYAKVIALAAAMASTITSANGNGACSEIVRQWNFHDCRELPHPNRPCPTPEKWCHQSLV